MLQVQTLFRSPGNVEGLLKKAAAGLDDMKAEFAYDMCVKVTFFVVYHFAILFVYLFLF